MKKICIDINSIIPLFINGHLSGVGRTTLELVQALSLIKDSLPFEIVLYSQNMKGIGGRNFDHPFKNKHLYFPNRDRWQHFLSFFPIKETLIDYDLLHIPHNFEYLYNPKKTVVTLHDAFFMKIQEKQFNHLEMRKNVPPMVRKVAAIMTCSESSKQDIMETMGILEEKITVVPWGISKELFYPENKKLIENFNTSKQLKCSYFASVSCSETRKNTLSVLRAFRQYIATGGNYDLVLLWSNPPVWILKEFYTEIINKRICFLAHLNNEELRALYSGATATFFPSKYEGFGLSILESMACGTPVVTCENSSLKELGQDVALYTKPEDLECMAQYMHGFESGQYEGLQLKSRGIEHASKFSWNETAKRYVEFYEKHM